MDLRTKQYINELESLKGVIDKVDDDEVKSFLARFFCIRTSGLMEVFLKERISEYSRGKVPSVINRFLTSKFKDITNLKSSRLVDVLKSFSPDWADSFENYLEEHEQQKNSLDSVIAQRHSIAHGQPASVSVVSMTQYFEDVKNVVNYLDTVIR